MVVAPIIFGEGDADRSLYLVAKNGSTPTELFTLNLDTDPDAAPRNTWYGYPSRISMETETVARSQLHLESVA